MVLSREDLLSRISERIGDDNSDEAISLIEDFSDTFDDLESKTNSDDEWKQKYEELDNEWRNKYKERFFKTETTPDKVKEDQKEDVIDDGKEVTFDDLFEEREG